MESVEREKVPTDPFAMESDVNVVLDAIFLVFVSFFLMLLGLDTNLQSGREQDQVQPKQIRVSRSLST